MFSGTAVSALIPLQGPWLGHEGTQQHVAVFYLNRYFMYLCHGKRRDDLQFSQAVVTNISAQGFREEVGEGGGLCSLQQPG